MTEEAAPSDVPPSGLGVDRSAVPHEVQELSWAAFDAHIQSLARAVAASFVPEAVVGVAHGGVFVGGVLASALGADFFPVRISRRARVPSRHPRLFGAMPKELKGRRVLIVDDVSLSGETLQLAKRLAKAAGAKVVRTATLVSREKYAADFTVLKSGELYVFPWDYADVTEDERFESGPPRLARGRR